jgi:peroxiredoxin (alkyl hydroperoxide reductase subunit C)
MEKSLRREDVFMPDEENGCVKPSRGPFAQPNTEKTEGEMASAQKVEVRMQAHLGKPAPDFEASAFVGNAFKNVKLSDYRGHWVVVCFYPGDFMFV